MDREREVMSVLIVHESMFGNTAAIAEAIADGITHPRGAPPGNPTGISPEESGGHRPEVRVVSVTEAPSTIGDDVDMLIVGGPTHAFSMSRESTRADAARQGATGSPRRGIREWIHDVQPREDLAVFTFDTRVHVRMLPGSAAKQAAIALRHRGFRHAERGESFWVGGVEGPLSHDEVVRAHAWGAFLGSRVVAV
jgi:hypothetical protein